MDCLWQVNKNKFMRKEWIYNLRRQKHTTFKDVVKKINDTTKQITKSRTLKGPSQASS
jgi:hypothetical protein